MKNLFSEEQKILDDFQNLVTDLDKFDCDQLRNELSKFINAYKKLIRQSKIIVQTSDNTQKKMNVLLERLSRYVSYQLYKKITKDKKFREIKTNRKKLTVFFSDLYHFSYMASHMEGEAFASFLNLYLNEMTKIIIKWGGTLDKYVGDAIMVFFGDPEFVSDQDHALRCVKMALEMRHKLKDIRQKCYNLGIEETLHCRMGIATGFCTVGNFGSSERMDYTAIGSPVNLASRLETACEVDEILISHETWSLVKDEIACEIPIKLNLKGFHQEKIAYKVKHIIQEEQEGLIEFVDANNNIFLKFINTKENKAKLMDFIQKSK